MKGAYALISLGGIVPLVLAGSTPASAAAGGAANPAVPAAPSHAPPHATVAPETFFITAFDVSGVTKLSNAEVERLVYPHAGPGRSKEDVEAARKSIQDAYAARGLEAVVVDVPVQDQQTFSQGIVQIAVNEVPVGHVRVTDSHYHALSPVRDAVPSLVEGKPINFKVLQTDIAAANRFPDRLINPEFKPGKVPGTMDVDLKLDDQRPLHASVEMDNDASPNTTPTRLTATARYTNLWQKGHTATVTFVVAPENPKDTLVFAGSYNLPFANSPWALALSGYRSNSNVAALGGSNVLGNGYQVGLRAVYHLDASHTVQTISFGPDFKDFRQKILVSGATASSAPIAYVPAELQYALSGATEHSSYSFSLGGTAGLRIVKGVICVDVSGVCVPSDQFRNREQYSNENFLRANLAVDYSYAFPHDILAEFRLNGQVADSHLITNEQFSGGGSASVRGYYSSEAVGDNGIAASLEVRSPSLAHFFGKWLTEARLFGFVDSSFIHVIDTLPEQTANFSLVGVGGGLRVRLFDKASGEVLGAVPLIDGPVSKRGDPRLSFQVKGEF